MYVCPAPFAFVERTVHHRTLIVLADNPVDADLVPVGTLTHRETESLIAAYRFDLKRNRPETKEVSNPNRGRENGFGAYGAVGDPGHPVRLR